MRIFLILAALLILTACGGSSDKSQSKAIHPKETTNTVETNNTAETTNTVETTPNSWVQGEFMPSRNFAGLCINPRSNNEYQDLVGTYLDENNWIRSWSHETYLWYNELPDIDPATPSLADPIDYFDLMKTSATTSSGRDKDQFHFTENTEEYNQYAEAGISAGYGAELKFLNYPRRLFIIYTESDSPARNANIGRGAEIISADGQLTSGMFDSEENFNTVINAAFPSEIGQNHTFVIKDPNSTTNRTVTLQSASIAQQPVHTSEVFTQNDKKIGYIALNTFAVATAETQLINTIYNLKNNQINELIIDLRYNGGGYLAISAELATMIAGNKAHGEIFTKLVFNSNRSQDNLEQPFPLLSFGIDQPDTAETPLPQLNNLTRVYIISTDNTASASESLINGLRGINNFEVILIGTTTTGKPYGFLPAENCGTTYFTIQFKGENAKGFGDYADGFIPSELDNGTDKVRGCGIMDDLTHPLGNENEAMLAAALYHIENGSCPTSNTDQLNSKPSHPLSAVRGQVIRRHPSSGLLLK